MGNNKLNNHISIFQWNCRAIQNKVPVLSNFFKQHFFHVVLLQSLNCTAFQLPKLDGFYYPPVFQAEKGRVMTAIYISIAITFNSLSLPCIDSVDCRFSLCGISIPSKGNKNTNILNAYYPCGISDSKQIDWINNLDLEDNNWVVCGDFNASNYLWDSEAPVGEDNVLADVIMNSYLTELNDGSFTRLGNKNQRNSAIDISLATADLTSSYSWTTSDDAMFSDHLPIFIDFHNQKSDIPDFDKTPKYRYQDANWDVFQALLRDECTHFNPVDTDINAYLENIRSMILRAADIAIPKTSPVCHFKASRTAEWWSRACDEAIANKRKAMRKYQKEQSSDNRTSLLEKEKECKAILENEKAKHWETFCLSEIQSPADLSLLWKKVNNLQNVYRQPVKPLEVNGQRTSSSIEKASVLAENFAKSSQSQYLSPDIAQLRHTEEATFMHPSPDNSTLFNQDFTLFELKKAINTLPSKEKATGSDFISNHMITHFPDTFLKVLLQFFQTCWSSGIVPSSWKDAIVIGIPKPGRPKHLASSYRPISLTPHISKLYERIVKVRLEQMLENNNIIPTCQAGFRKNRRCMEHVVHLIEHVKRATCNKQTTVATFFDIKRAFDSVWHAKLLNKMHTIGISGHLYNFVKSFIENRRIAVQVGSAISPHHVLDMGVPQGSVIAPLLFSIMLYDIESEIGKPGLFLSLFADDLAVWSDCNSLSTKGRKLWLKRYQTTVNSIQIYMHKNGFELSAEKTALMVFTRKFKSRKDFYITINNEKITHSTTTKFLGVILHQNLSWEPHVQHLISKARRGVSAIKRLCGVTWITQKSMIHLTQALVRSRLCYGHEATFTQSDSQWLALERIELRALKAALGTCVYAVNDLVYQNIGWLPLRDQSKLLTAKFQTKSLRVSNNVKTVLTQEYSSNNDVHRQRLRKNHPQIYKSTTPISSYTEDLNDLMLPISSDPSPLVSNSFSLGCMQAQFDFAYADSYAKNDNPLLLASLAKERINMFYRDHLKYYTDGSILNSGETGCAFIAPDLQVKEMFKLNSGVSIFSAEIYAIDKACEHINSLITPPKNVVIITDSKSVLQALKKGGTQNRKEIQVHVLNLITDILKKGTNLSFMWVPSHVGIHGNDVADKAAKAATVKGAFTNIGFSLSELIQNQKNRIYNNRSVYLKKRCIGHEWLYLPGLVNHIPHLPRHFQKIINRIRVLAVAHRFKPVNCLCGSRVSLQHCIDCLALPQMDPVRNLKIKNNLHTEHFLQPHESLGDIPMRTLASSIINSNIKQWF
jgi:ribonuclease HI